MEEYRTISQNNPSFPAYLNFQTLRELGIKHLQELSGKVWTDYNLHDPGVTILEVLCYAITDLGYRNNLDIKDLLALKPGDQDSRENNFFTPDQVLTCNPVTELDWRKRLIDIEGVRNAWLEKIDLETYEPEIAINWNNSCLEYYDGGSGESETENRFYPRGLYRVWLDLEPTKRQDPCGNPYQSRSEALEEVNQVLLSYRNLCEDFQEVMVLEAEEIGLCCDLELTRDADPEDVLVQVYVQIQKFLRPHLKFYTLKQLLDKGKNPGEIFAGRPAAIPSNDKRFPDGPTDNPIPYSHGFIEPEELPTLMPPPVLHTSDLYQEILKVPGVEAVRKLRISSYINGLQQSEWESWCLPLSEGYYPTLGINHAQVTLYKGEVPLGVDRNEVEQRYFEQQEVSLKVARDAYELDLPIPQGRYYETLADHYSIQHDFPLTYGISEEGLPDHVSPLRKAQAKQLKGYLVFFDQLLANYLSQLAHVRDIFSWEPEYDLNLILLKSTDTIPQNGENLVIVVKIGDSYHARIFDMEGKIVVDKQLQPDTTLKQELDTALANSAIIDEKKRELIRKITSSLGHTPQNGRSPEQRHTYFTQSFDFPGKEHILKDTQYLDAIGEDETTYRKRRNRFLDHLLARFAESFAEYALLNYQVRQNGQEKAVIETNLIEDKANFLRNYPTLARDRFRAFNYSQTPICNTDNISGFQQRVSNLLGMEEVKQQSLSPEPLQPEPKDFIWSLPLDTEYDLNLMSLSGTDGLPQNGENLVIVAKIGDSYHARIFDMEGKIFVDKQLRPDTTLKPELDTAFANPNIDGQEKRELIRKITSSLGCSLVLQSQQAYSGEDEARMAFEEFQQLGQNPNQYERLSIIYQGTPKYSTYSYVILNSERFPLAFCPKRYEKPEERDRAMTALQEWLGQSPNPDIQEREAGYIGQVRDTEAVGQILLQGTQRYPTEKRAWQDINDLIKLAEDKQNFQLIDGDKGKGIYGWELIHKTDAPPLLSDFYSTSEARDKAIKDLRERIKKLSLTMEGFHVLEHILLRPRTILPSEGYPRDFPNNLLPIVWLLLREVNPMAGILFLRKSLIVDRFPRICVSTEDSTTLIGNPPHLIRQDPYSFWISIILPYWPQRFQNINFRRFVEQTLRLEAPAHVALRIAWLEPVQMRAFEYAYGAWLEQLALATQGNAYELTWSLNRLLDILSNLESVYPSGNLFDPDPERSTTKNNPIILNQTVLGSTQ